MRARLPVLAIVLFILSEVAVFVFADPPEAFKTIGRSVKQTIYEYILPDIADTPICEATPSSDATTVQAVSDGSGHAAPLEKTPPYDYHIMDCEYGGHKSRVHVLEVEFSTMEGFEVKPVLSYDSMFGFEHLSSMSLRTGAVAAINGGFFSTYGEPSGMVVIDGKMLKKPTGQYPVLLIDNGRISLEPLYLLAYLNTPKGGKLTADHINTMAREHEVVIFTPEFGSSNRVASINTTLTVRNGIIEGVVSSLEDTAIPDDGFLVTFMGVFHQSFFDSKGFETGRELEISFEPDIGADQAYECGCWIIKDGVDVTAYSDPWIGVLTNRDPRTAVGLKDDGTLVFIVVDGRQPDYSAGFTAKELAAFFLEYGVHDAAMLDGGASTEMIVEGRIVNRPSYKGRERMIGGCIAIIPANASNGPGDE